MKINFACGRNVIEGFYNIDAQRSPRAPRAPELLFAMEFTPNGDLIRKIPLDDGCADYIQSMHFIEHVFRWEAPAVIAEFLRILKPGGRLVLELPNIEEACRNLLAGMTDQMCMWPLYGDWGHKDPYMMHKHGYTKKTIVGLLKECGLEKIQVLPPRTHKKRANRDMRVEAIK